MLMMRVLINNNKSTTSGLKWITNILWSCLKGLAGRQQTNWNFICTHCHWALFFWCSAVYSRSMTPITGQAAVVDEEHDVARHPQSSRRWGSCLGKIADVVSRCIPRGFYFRVSFSSTVGCSSIIDTSMQGSCQRQPCCHAHELSWWSRTATCCHWAICLILVWLWHYIISELLQFTFVYSLHSRAGNGSLELTHDPLTHLICDPWPITFNVGNM